MIGKANEKIGEFLGKEKQNAEENKASDWVELKPAEIIELVKTLSNQGRKSVEIGAMLRDSYGIPSVKAIIGKRITQILEEQGLRQEIPEDLMNLITISVKLQKHLQEHKKDFKAKHGYQLAVSKIRRLAKYYIKAGKIPSTWRFTAETAQLLVK